MSWSECCELSMSEKKLMRLSESQMLLTHFHNVTMITFGQKYCRSSQKQIQEIQKQAKKPHELSRVLLMFN